MSIKRLLTAAALAVTVTPALFGPGAGGQTSSLASAPGLSAASALTADRVALAARFGQIRERAVAPGATREDRTAFVEFVRRDVLPYLHGTGVVLYPIADSVAGAGGYATVGALLEREAIERLANRVAAVVDSGDPVTFRSRTEALAAVLDTYFIKDDLLIVPILVGRLSDRELRALLARVERERAAF